MTKSISANELKARIDGGFGSTSDSSNGGPFGKARTMLTLDSRSKEEDPGGYDSERTGHS